MVYVLLGEGYEEIEAIAPVDILRRAEIKAQYAGIGGRLVKGAHGIFIEADITVEEMSLDSMEMIVIPGGFDGVEAIRSNETAMSAIKYAYEKGVFVAAICAGPSILGAQGWLDGKNVTCYPGMESYMGKGTVTGKQAVQEGKIITGRAPSSAIDFALALVEAIKGKEKADYVAGFLVHDRA